jgi:hypothetical protein
MANELVQGLFQSLLAPQQTQQNDPTAIMAAINSPNPMAAAMAYNLGSTGQVTKGLLGQISGGRLSTATPQEYMQQAVTASPELLQTSAGMQQLAQMAQQAGDRPTALRLSLMSQEKAVEEQTKRTATAKTQLQIGTGTGYLTNLMAGVENPKARAELAAIVNPVSSGAITVEQGIEQANEVLGRYKIEPPEADTKDFEFPNGSVLTLREGPDGKVFYNGSFQDPSELGLRSAATRTAARTTVETPVDPRGVDALTRWASSMNFLPADSNDPIALGYMSALDSGQIKTQEDALKWFENMPGTPAFNQRQSAIKTSALMAVGPSLRNIDQANAILFDPASRVGSAWSITEDYPIGSAAGRLKAAIEPIISAAALQQINTLKTQSAELGGEGTGLGTVAVKEFESLQNSIENLRTSRTKADLQSAMGDYQLHILNIRNLNSGRPLIVTADDPTYSGLPLYATPTGTAYMVNGQLVPVEIYESVDEATTAGVRGNQ